MIAAHSVLPTERTRTVSAAGRTELGGASSSRYAWMRAVGAARRVERRAHSRRESFGPLVIGGAWRAFRRGLLAPNSLADRKSTRLNSSHTVISYAVFC